MLAQLTVIGGTSETQLVTQNAPNRREGRHLRRSPPCLSRRSGTAGPVNALEFRLNEYGLLRRWRVESVYPFWSTRGLDRASGGVTPDGTPIDEPQRDVGRQLFSFAPTPSFFWLGADANLVTYGRQYVEQQLWSASPTPSWRATGGSCAPISTCATTLFLPFGLAACRGPRSCMSKPFAGGALALVARRKASAHPMAEFKKGPSRQLPLLANPQMHLLEAALAWREISLNPFWANLAREIGNLFLETVPGFLDRRAAESRPRPMIEIGGRPILWHTMRLYSRFGFVICAGSKEEVIKQHFLHYDAINSDFTARLLEHSITITARHHAVRWESRLPTRASRP